MNDDMLNAALRYARFGFLVFPAPPGKKLSYKAARYYGGRRWGATADPEEIREDWRRWPEANVCIATGRESKIFVIDVDTADGHGVDGFATLAELENKYGPLPPTWQVVSPSGSKHFYFRYPTAGVVKNDTGRLLGPGIDVRGDGGMVVAPPSLKGDKRYEMIGNGTMADAPPWLELKVKTSPETENKKGDWGQLDVPMLEAAMKVLPTALEWHERNKIGMALFAATEGSNEGLALWDEWLRRSGKYNAGATRGRWRALKNSAPTSIGAGSIMWLANQANANWQVEYEQELIEAIYMKGKRP